MPMPSLPVAAVLLAIGAAAQDPSGRSHQDALAAADTAIAERRWDDALAGLLQARTALGDEAARTAPLRASLASLAAAARQASRLEVAAAAGSALLELVRARHGGADHIEVVDTLILLAGDVEDLGRAAEAVPHAEAALAMALRLHGDGDHDRIASARNCLASALEESGRAGDALPHYEAALAMRRRLHGSTVHVQLAVSLNNLASCLQVLGRHFDAMPLLEQSLAMRRRLAGGRDDMAVARGTNNLALCLRRIGRVADALPLFEESPAMRRRLHGGDDHPDVARGRNNLGLCLQSLDRLQEALPHYEAALATWRRLLGDVHPSVVTGANRVGSCLRELGRYDEALTQYELALSVCRRLHGERAHPDTATALHGYALTLELCGRGEEAVQHCEQALAIWQRLFPGRDHPEHATTRLMYARQLLFVRGDPAAALSQFEQVVAMRERVFGGRDHPEVAAGRHDLAFCLIQLGREAEALGGLEDALAMYQRLGSGSATARRQCQGNIAQCLFALGRREEALVRLQALVEELEAAAGQRDDRDLAIAWGTLATYLSALGRRDEALARHAAMHAMLQRWFGGRDHADLVRAHVFAVVLTFKAGRFDEMETHATAGLAMARRLYGERDHPLVALALDRRAAALVARREIEQALGFAEAAAAMMERLRASARASAEVRQSLFDDLKGSGVFERLQLIHTLRGDGAGVFTAAERARGRGLLDLVEEQRFDVMAEAERRAGLRGDGATAARLAELRAEAERQRLEGDRLLHLLTQRDAAGDAGDAEAVAARRSELLAASDANAVRQRQLADERARLLGDVQPLGGVRSASEVQAVLRSDELMLHYTIGPDFSQLRVLARDFPVGVFPLRDAHAALQRFLPSLLQATSRAGIAARGRDPEPATGAPGAAAAGRELFAALVPAAVWDRVRGCARVFVAAHGELHRLPFELLVAGDGPGGPVPWLECGPPIAYVPSGSMLHWLRRRAADARDDATALELLAVGDPGRAEATPLPEHGALVLAVGPDGAGARTGLRPGDVLVRYAGDELIDDRTLRDRIAATAAAIEDGQRADGPIAIEAWRRGVVVELSVQRGPLGIEVGRGGARAAAGATTGVLRAGEIERLRELPPLLGARAETEAIEAVFAGAPARAKRLLGADASEPAVFDLAAKAKYLHFACHGIAEEYAGQSLSMLVLSPPPHVLPGDDGLLQLTDLLHAWRGRLASCRLVVLSACRTNVGPTLRDEAPQALPIGFLFAGAPAVISSLWAVDDASTRELMVDFYRRLLAGETDQLAAFTAAKKALRSRYPDPFHWAPFLYLGSPE